VALPGNQAATEKTNSNLNQRASSLLYPFLLQESEQKYKSLNLASRDSKVTDVTDTT
jgi:hypothetical protein